MELSGHQCLEDGRGFLSMFGCTEPGDEISRAQFCLIKNSRNHVPSNPISLPTLLRASTQRSFLLILVLKPDRADVSNTLRPFLLTLSHSSHSTEELGVS